MRPRHTPHNPGNGTMVYAVNFSQTVSRGSGCVSESDLYYLSCDERTTRPFLPRHILLIVIASAKKQMVRIHTRRVVASVQHAHARRDFSARHLKRHSMCLPSERCSVRVERKRPVWLGFTNATRSPFPAWPKIGPHDRAALIDLIPETVSGWYFRFTQGMNLHRLGLALVRLVRLRQQAFEPSAF